MAEPPNSRPRSLGFHPLEDFQNGPRIPRPNFAEEMIPVVGPVWEAAGDLQDGHYWSAAGNLGLGLADALPVGTALKGGRAAFLLSKKALKARDMAGAIKALRGDLRSGAYVQRTMHGVGLAEKGEEAHHVFELNGTPRNVPSWKNNYAFMKALPQETHRRLHGRWSGKPKFGPVPRAWHGTTDWMKTVPAGLLGEVTGAAENWGKADDTPP